MSDEIRALAVKTDSALAAIYADIDFARLKAQSAADTLIRLTGGQHHWGKEGFVDQNGDPFTFGQAVAKLADGQIKAYFVGTAEAAFADYKRQEQNIANLLELAAPLEAVYAKHRWQRAYLVTSSDGHVHSSRGCSTCFPTTQFAWRTEYSGASEAEIVEAAGELACTVCYPSAPVDVLKRPSEFTRTEREAAAVAKAEKAAAKAAKEAQRVAKAATKDGSVLEVKTDSAWPERFKTERSALSWAVSTLVWAEWSWSGKPARGLSEIESSAIDTIAVAIAEKRGVTPDLVWDEISAKARKQIAKLEREK